MVSYNFKLEFAGDVRTGVKRLTLRRLRTPPAKHAMVNDPATLWTGQRTKQAQRLGVGIVQVRALLRISARGIVRVSEYRSGTNLDPGAEMIAAALIGNNADALAHADGFENWAAAWAWHDAHREKKESGSTAILRELIAWRLLPPEVEAAFDRGDWMMEAA